MMTGTPVIQSAILVNLHCVCEATTRWDIYDLFSTQERMAVPFNIATTYSESLANDLVSILRNKYHLVGPEIWLEL